MALRVFGFGVSTSVPALHRKENPAKASLHTLAHYRLVSELSTERMSFTANLYGL